MMKIFVCVILILWTNVGLSAQKNSPDLILYNGKIFTADDKQPNVEAIAIGGERILAVGASGEIKKLAGAKTRLIDLQGRTVIPGLNDAHVHFMPDPKGFRLDFKTMEPSWTETIEAVKNAVERVPKGEWIFGEIGYTALANDAANRSALDRIAPHHPVLLRSFYGHGYIVNSNAMPLLQISENEPDVLGGRFERLPNSNKINGRFWEYAQWKPNRILANLASDEKIIDELKKISDEAARYGITSMQIMSSLSIDRFVRLLRKADLPIRVRAIPFAMTDIKKRDLSEFARLAKLENPKSKIQASGIKWILDGTPFERGAAMRESYRDQPDWKGQLNFPESEISKMLDESLKFKQQIMFHCVGDRCVQTVFDAMEKIKIDWRAKRVRIEHGDAISGDLIARAKKLGVIVVQNPSHFTFVEMFYARYSPNTKFLPVRSLIENRVLFALGSDGPLNPFLNVMFASIHPTRPTEAPTREQAVVAYTNGSAFAEFAENEKGALSRGKVADLAVLSQDVFSIPASELPKTDSILTVVGGKIVHDKKALK